VTLERYGWNVQFESIFEDYRNKDLIPARIIRVDRGAATAQTAEGPVTVSIAGSLDPAGEHGPPAVGDWVGVDVGEDSHVVSVILPRAGALSRRRPGEADLEQVVAANVSHVLVVESHERGPNARRIERASALAWDGGATPVVILTKIDTCPDLDAAVATARGAAPFSDVLAVSAVTGDGVEALERQLTAGSTAVLLGPSGVGKSTLTNRLLGEEKFAVAEVRAGDGKGRHTTTHRELVALPGGACLIDTPGVRELGLWLSAEAVATAFPEIEEAAQGCRFGDCRHESEPGCAVRSAVEHGVLEEKRLASFLRLRKEAENLDMRRDSSRQHEIRAKERVFGKIIREALKKKGHR
jgi:ribosome biogenesis GTPase